MHGGVPIHFKYLGYIHFGNTVGKYTSGIFGAINSTYVFGC